MADTTQSAPGSLSRSAAPPNSAQPDGERVVSRALDEAREMGTEWLAAVCDSASSLFDEQRGRAADEIAAVGEALKHSAQSLDKDTATGSFAAQYAGQAAARIDKFAATLRNRSPGQLAADIEDFARRRPTAYMALAIAAGFVGGRFLLSAAPSSGAPPAAASAIPQHSGFEPGRSTSQATGGSGAAMARENG